MTPKEAYNEIESNKTYTHAERIAIIQQCAYDAVYDALRQERAIAIGINVKLVTERDLANRKRLETEVESAKRIIRNESQHWQAMVKKIAAERDELKAKVERLKSLVERCPYLRSKLSDVDDRAVCEKRDQVIVERDELQEKLDAVVKPEVPEGYEIIDYRKPRCGDIYLTDGGIVSPIISSFDWAVTQRYILRKTEVLEMLEQGE